jgi:hypothetical protein
MTMKDSDRTRFGQLLAGLCDYYEKQPGETTVALYWHGLREYDIEEVEAAAATHMRDPDRGRWMPKISDFVQAVEGSADEAAAIAWDAVLHRREIDETAKATLASMGGWSQAIGRQLETEIPFIARNFQLRYKAYARRGAARSQIGSATIGEVLRLATTARRRA